ncbi:phosphoglycerate mutase (2,3-diphosphoglycerate-independent) [Candidatus Uhrbacteria bacterium RIFCSPHIGHO2_12_FULL_54_23]|uniref:2,3-bisphosphoglycerate-independent phosphoglycerate mutase n=2 Tax=Candidatus Uhriibacteriota TaxID=1752732 RepID=A0A1F7UMJ2_9BACT|nr:MAG: phosphoglycerate mutase (2,3-diphosphoglycerate-independent) [Candidatus Uhrbacteria bacterium RIFCSPHIGHO2_12_FULL_54_23]OGL84998.1 MAG: phosphoglycerate mutase (2,3-diphosphoglycerate-independent) [Candidatus Uhrbacteria bacterium RIFCSPLOWO2_01_FULL_55_36]
MASKPLVLIIRDGWGVAPDGPGNAVARAKTPFHDRWKKEFPPSLLQASGEAIGLPAGFQGNSEVGHLNIGTGRPVKQELTFIHETIANGSFFKNKKLREALDVCRKEKKTLHLIGILQDAGVHAHEEHLFALLKAARDHVIKRTYLHVLADGRDSPSRSVKEFIERVRKQFPDVRFGSITGRHLLDRAGNWHLTEALVGTFVRGTAPHVATIEEAVDRAYGKLRPDGAPMSDEFIPSHRIGDFQKIEEGDTVVFFNFRQDRMIQLTRAFAERRYGAPAVRFLTLTRPYDEFQDFLFAPHDEGEGLAHGLGETLSHAHKRQLRMADGQKFRHVTSFLNGKRIVPFPGEDRLEIKIGGQELYRTKPGMGAEEIAETAPAIIKNCVYDFMVVNFANADMIGHVGEFALAVRAVEIVDACVGTLVEATLAAGGEALVTADHGNIEQMYEDDGKTVRVAHTLNPVECYYVSRHPQGTLAQHGILPSLAPTVLDLLGIPLPVQMTAPSLLMRKV